MINKEAQQIADQLIREGLDNLRPAAPESSWNTLAQRLEEADAVPTEAQEVLRDKLNSLTPAYDPKSWAALNDRLNNEESDGIFYYGLDTNAPVPPVSNWAALAAKLELIAARRTAIYSFKFSEACVLASFLLAFWSLSPLTWQDTEQEQVKPQPILATADADQQPNAVITNRSLVANVPLTNTATAEDEIDYAGIDRPSIIFETTQPEAQPVHTIAIAKATTVEGLRTATAIAPLPDIDIFLAIAEPDLQAPPTQLVTLKQKNPRSIYLRPFISPWDFNQVITPEQAVNDIILERDNRISYGRSAGLLFETEYRNHSMQYGLVYGIRSYIPTVLKDVEDFEPNIGPFERRDTNYSRITFQTISMPVVFQLPLVSNDRWKIAASAGIAANLNIWATFKKSPTFDQDVLNWTRETPQPRFGPRSSDNKDILVLDAKDLVYPEHGLLQGGSLLNNISMAASIGFSIERRMNDKLSVYIAPNFSRSIYYQKGSGVEPFRDRIHSNSVQFGTRILLGTRK